MEIIDTSSVTQAQRLKISRERLSVDLPNAGAASIAFRDVTVTDPGREQVTQLIDFPRLVFVGECPVGPQRGIEA